jgi:hypothetical protein
LHSPPQLENETQTYDVPHPTLPNTFTNEPPYCEQYFSARNIPWGFTAMDIPGHESPGYPVWLDINLSSAEAMRWVQYLEDAMYFDTATESMTFELVTYNAKLRHFSKTTILFKSDTGGTYKLYSNVNTLKVCTNYLVLQTGTTVTECLQFDWLLIAGLF